VDPFHIRPPSRRSGSRRDHRPGVLLGYAVPALGIAGAALWIGRAGGKSWIDNAEQITAR